MQPHIKYCTLTGVEDSTDINALFDLAAEFTFVEWGVLLAGNRAGSGRFPTWRWLDRLVSRMDAHPGAANFSLHLCGPNAQSFLFSPRSGVTGEMAKHFPRIQLNFFSRNYQTADIARAIQSVAETTRVITQHSRANEKLGLALLPFELRNHDILFDQSGGRGKLPGEWPSIADELRGIPHGYSGGLGPDNVALEVPLILRRAGQPVSIDMEGRMRSPSDCFDLNLARQVLESVRPFTKC